MSYLSKSEIRDKRGTIFQSAERITVLNKFDQRPASLRICSVCGKHLTQFMPLTGKYITTVKHKHCVVADWVKFNLCHNIKSCYTQNEGSVSNVNVGKFEKQITETNEQEATRSRDKKQP